MIKTDEKEMQVIDSREIAEMMGRTHSDIMKMIQGSGKNLGIIPTLTKGNFHVVNYFIESTYVDAKGETRKCYLVTKMGCEMLGNKQQGEKGILFTAKYVERFNQMENKIAQLQKQETQLANLLVAIYNGGQDGVVASKQLAEIEVKKATTPLLETIEINKPKVEYHDSVLNSKRLVTVREIAVDLGTSAIKLNKFLNENGIQYKDKANNTWLLYTKHSNFINDGLCDYKITDYGQQLKWTELGRKYIIDLWNSKQN